MPTYEYQCRACDHAFELFQSMSAPVKRKCPACGKSKLERLIGTGAGIIFKGGGFYETDYRSDSYRKGAEAEKKASEPAPQSTASGGETKTTDAKKKDQKSTATEPPKAKAETTEKSKVDAPKTSGGSRPKKRARR